MVIQLLYILNNSDVSPIVFMSLTFTILSLFFSFLSQLSRLCQILRRRDFRFLNNDLITCRLTIKCKDLQRYHQCTQKKIENCLMSVLKASPSLMELHQRLDTSFEIEVFEIQSSIESLQSIDVLFDATILSDEYVGNSPNHVVLRNKANSNSQRNMSKMTDNIVKNILSIGKVNHQNYMTMQSAIRNSLKLRETANVDLTLTVIRSHSVDVENQAVWVCPTHNVQSILL